MGAARRPGGEWRRAVRVLRVADRPGSPAYAAPEKMSAAGLRSVLFDAAAGFVLRRTKLRSFSGSSQQSVPVEPLWPYVLGDDSFPKPRVSIQPRPQAGVKPPV